MYSSFFLFFKFNNYMFLCLLFIPEFIFYKKMKTFLRSMSQQTRNLKIHPHVKVLNPSSLTPTAAAAAAVAVALSTSSGCFKDFSARKRRGNQ